MQSNHDLKIGDLVYILDLLTKLNYPRLARVKNINQDSAGTDRYYELEYRLGRKFSTVQRPAQSLCIIMTKEEQKKGHLVDSLSFLDDSDLKSPVEKKKVVVKAAENVDNIVDL